MKLNPTQIKNLKPEPGKKVTRHYDGNGLFLFITDKGQKWWRFKFSFAGKEGMLSLGTFPKVSLKEARQQADELKEMIRQGINPAMNRKATKAAEKTKDANSFEVVAREWFNVKRTGKAETTRIKEIASLENDVFPYIGERPISELTPPDLLMILRRVEGRGAVDTAHRIKSRCSMIFRYAIATGRCISDPCRDLIDALTPIVKGHFPAITEMQRFSELLRAIDGYMGTPIVRAALKLAPLTATRPGELRHSKWSDIDLDAGEWRYFVTKTKIDQIVPLPRQAVEILRALKNITFADDDSFVFPHISRKDRPMSDNAVLCALRAMGFSKEEMTGHGFRTSCKTEMLELGYPLQWLEKQLAHAPKDAHGRAYNRTEYREQRHAMMQTWADYLDELKASPNPDIKALRDKYKYRG